MRRTQRIEIDDRGTVKTFELQELGALQMERWAVRACKLLIGTGILSTLDVDAIQTGADLPAVVSKIINGGAFGALSRIDQKEYEALENEMLLSVAIVQPSGNRMKLTPVTIEGNIDDYRTIMKLVFEAVKFNLNFSLPSAPSSAEHQKAEAPANGRKPSISLRH